MKVASCIYRNVWKSSTLLLLLSCPLVMAQTPQERVHKMSRTVMPFDVSKTIHVFKMTDTGGIEKVLARDPRETGQIALIRQHLKHEAQKFQRGDYSDPAKLHGKDMPGLQELEANAARIKITYMELPAGAQITFTTHNVHLLTAIHRWFGAQLSEHGADARPE